VARKGAGTCFAPNHSASRRLSVLCVSPGAAIAAETLQLIKAILADGRHEAVFWHPPPIIWREASSSVVPATTIVRLGGWWGF